MFRQKAGILFALIISVASLRINQEPEFQEWEEHLPGYHLGTRDQIMFDKGASTLNCDDIRPFDMNACREYEHSRALKYKDSRVLEYRNREEKREASSSRIAKIKVFLHVSKSAGTLACHCGRAAGEITKEPLCHALREDFPWWGNESMYHGRLFAAAPITKLDDCDKYAEALAKQHVTMEHNENFLPREGKLCDNSENIIIVRDPIQRLASHINYLIGEELALNMTLAKINAGYARLADNYLARSLAGSSAFRAELGALPETTGEKTIQTLRNFDNVFIQDDSLNTELEHHYGWECDTVQARVSTATGGTPAIVDYWKKTWPKEDWESLLNQHKFDRELFEEAKSLSFQKSFLRYKERFSESRSKFGMENDFQQQIVERP